MGGSWLDRAALALSPGWAQRRAEARLGVARAEARMGAIRGYEAARMPARDLWRDRSGAPNDEVGGALARLRSRSRAMLRDNPYAKKMAFTTAGHQVGYGIRQRVKTDDKATNQRTNKLFETWAKRAVVGGQLDIFGLQHQSAWARFESGEVLVRAVRLTMQEARARGLVVPLQFEVLEADLLAGSLDSAGRALGPRVVQGVQFDRTGNREGYWLLGAHPGESAWSGTAGARFWPASEVMHLYRAYAERPGTVRGVPDLTPSIARLWRLDDYEMAAIEQARSQSMIGIIWEAPDGGEVEVATPGGVAGGSPETQEPGGPGAPLEMYPGMVASAPAGTKAHYLQPGSAGPFEPFSTHQLRAIAAGAGCTYDQATGDLRQANYSSLRAGRAEFRRLVEQDQWLMLIHQLCEPMWRLFVEVGTASGALEDGEYPVTHMPPRIELIDPSQDVPALRSMRRLGLQTWQQQVMEQGYDPDEQAEELEEENADWDERGLILDGDPRRISLSGGAHDPKQLAAVEIAATGAAQPRRPDLAAQGAPPVAPFPRRAS